MICIIAASFALIILSMINIIECKPHAESRRCGIAQWRTPHDTPKSSNNLLFCFEWERDDQPQHWRCGPTKLRLHLFSQRSWQLSRHKKDCLRNQNKGQLSQLCHFFGKKKAWKKHGSDSEVLHKDLWYSVIIEHNILRFQILGSWVVRKETTGPESLSQSWGTTPKHTKQTHR